jgi:hypothetical protein
MRKAARDPREFGRRQRRQLTASQRALVSTWCWSTNGGRSARILSWRWMIINEALELAACA